MAVDYPPEYHPVYCCYNCEHGDDSLSMHHPVCTKHDLIVGCWCICNDYEEEVSV